MGPECVCMYCFRKGKYFSNILPKPCFPKACRVVSYIDLLKSGKITGFVFLDTIVYPYMRSAFDSFKDNFSGDLSDRHARARKKTRFATSSES